MFNNSKYWLRYTFGFAQIEIENWMTSEVLSSALPLIYIATKYFSNLRTFKYDNIIFGIFSIQDFPKMSQKPGKKIAPIPMSNN
ncbi:MAG: hypothetical protein ACK4WG_11620, partial [Aphanizomenon sp.]